MKKTKENTSEQRGKKLPRKIVKVIWVLFFALLIGPPLFIYMVEKDAFGLFGGLPGLEKLERPDPNLSSELIADDGTILGKYYKHNRSKITYEELSPELINTLLVTEDIRFKSHPGIDLRGIVRAAKGVITGRNQGGGSTITMQLAQNLYRTESTNKGSLYSVRKIGSIITKIKEYIISVKLERNYTKKEIMAMYLNTIEYGQNSYGIKVAAKTYFDKLPSELNYKESAIIVGLINKPTKWNPIQNPENAMRKRTEILYNLFKNDLITREGFDSLKVSDFGLNFKVDSHNSGPAPYFRSVAKNFLMRWAKEKGYNIYKDGLKIYTTIDPRMQKYAEEAVAEHMKGLQATFDKEWENQIPWRDNDGQVIENFLEREIRRGEYYRVLREKHENNKDSIQKYLKIKRPMKVFSWSGEIDTVFNHYDSLSYYKRFLQTGFMAMEPKSGHIKAWVGGIDFKYFQYDHVKQSRRQPGSTIKPIVYTTAIENLAYSPCLELEDIEVVFELPGQEPPTWSPDNANGKYTGEKMTIRQGMAQSVNSITAHVMKSVGPRNVVKYAERMGIESKLDPVPTLCLGAGGEVSVYEMVGVYSTFVNKGKHTRPIFISRIEDKNGNLIENFTPEVTEAITEKTAYTMLYM
ncbi:MAG: transglycosylase domain-containing protein, partial [Cyclobacteriaceae bacterium]